MKFWNIFLFLLFTHFAIADASIPNNLYQVVGITDGDTLTAIDNENKQYKVRLSDIDAPEKHQDFGEKSKQVLSNLVFNKNVKIDIKQLDKYGRFIGRVYVDNIDVSLEMVRLGMAHHYKKYSTDQQIASAEEYAKANKLGLWSNPNPINPEQFRHSKKENKSEDFQQRLTSPPESKPIHKGKKCGDSYISQDKECHIDSIVSDNEPSKKTKHRKSINRKEKSDSEKPKKRGNPYRDEKGRFTTKEKAVNNPKNKKSKKHKKEEE